MRKNEIIIGGVSIALGTILPLLSTLIPWASLHVDTSLGTFPVKLDSDFYVYKVEYEANASTPLGVNATISESKIYLTERGDYEEAIGFVKGSSKIRNYFYKFTSKNGTARVYVETYAENIPWWPVGTIQHIEVRILINESENLNYIKVKKVYLQIKKGDEYRNVWEHASEDVLTPNDDSITYKISIDVSEDWGEIDIVGFAELEMYDRDGNKNLPPLKSYSKAPPSIKIWTVSYLTTTRIIMFVISFPTMLSGIIVSVVSNFLLYKRKKRFWSLILIAGIINIVSSMMFLLGITALVELMGYTDFLSLSYGLSLPVISGATMIFFILSQKKAKLNKPLK